MALGREVVVGGLTHPGSTELFDFHHYRFPQRECGPRLLQRLQHPCRNSEIKNNKEVSLKLICILPINRHDSERS